MAMVTMVNIFRGAIVKKGILLGMSAMIVAGTLLAAAAPAAGQGRDPEAQRRRNQLRLMEGVLVQAVRLGAEQVGKELERYEPTGVTVLLGVPRARGFVLDGHGLFFDVEIPDMNQSVVWSVMMARREQQVGNAIDSLRAALRLMPAGPPMQQAQMALQVVEKTVGPIPPDVQAGVPGELQPGIQTAAQSEKSTPSAQPAPGQVKAATAIAPEPRALYRAAVIDAVSEAMLDYSLQMALGPEEWLTVATRGSEGPLTSQGLSDPTTIILRVKGSDLAIYHADPARRDEIRQKVKSEARLF
jgi:hypothetical protein